MAELDKFYSLTGTPDETAKQYFAEVFTRHGSDKTGFHNYESVYSALFKDRAKITDVLEMGIHRGASLRAWKEIFPNAMIVGLDFDPANFYTEERITSIFVDQDRDETFEQLLKFLGGKQFPLIIDDGSHELERTNRTFHHLLPSLEVGGWFIVEDIPEVDEHHWHKVVSELPGNYQACVVNMLEITRAYGDNIILAVTRIQ